MHAAPRGVTRRSAAASRAASGPAPKRRRAAHMHEEHVPHPLGVKPAGNALTDATTPATMGLLSFLPEPLLWSLLEQLDGPDLARAGRTCRALYAWTREEELWKLALNSEFGRGPDAEVPWRWAGSWRHTYACHASRRALAPAPPPVRVASVFSDYLYALWRTVAAARGPWCDAPDSVARLTAAEFGAQGGAAYKRPSVITDVVGAWPAARTWTREALEARYGAETFYVNSGARQRLSEYFAYADSQRDELPVYLFDHTFGEAHPDLLADFTVPALFAEDLFALLGARRPNFRWLLVGPARAGATFHLDPHHTSAWNAVLSGSKKWVFYPPHMTPPGVYPSPDGLEVRAPLSIVDWFLNFYRPGRGGPDEPLEVVQRPGELVYVPSGWWHCVLNLEPSIALTQNFVDSHNLRRVLAYLAAKPSQGLRHDFTAALQAHAPHKLAAASAPTASADGARPLWSAVRADAATPFRFDFANPTPQ